MLLFKLDLNKKQFLRLEVTSTNYTKMTQFCLGMPSVLYKNLHCHQDDFNIVICVGYNEATELKGPNLETSAKLSPMLTLKYFCRTDVIGSDIYALGGYVGVKNLSCSIEMFSGKTNTWKDLESQTTGVIITDFSVCSFMKSIYVVGGRFNIKIIILPSMDFLLV